MIILQEYSVKADGSSLTIDVKANTTYDGVYLSALQVSCDGTFADEAKTKFDNLIATATNEYTGAVIDWEEHPTEIRIELPLKKAPYVFCDSPFYLRVTAEDPEQSVTACGVSNQLTACTFNKYPLYQHIACTAREFDGCDSPKHFIDYLLRLKALEANIAVGSAQDINYYYNWLIAHSNSGNFTPTTIPLNSNSGCGCNS